MALWMKADGEVKEVHPEHGSGFTLAEMQGMVGGYIENVYLHSTGQVLVVNEDGKSQGLPMNMRATDLYQAEIGPFDAIVGDAILCSLAEVS